MNFAQNEGSMGHTRQSQPSSALNDVGNTEGAKEWRGQYVEKFLKFRRRHVSDIQYILVIDRETLRHEETRRIAQIHLINDRNLALRRRFRRRCPIQRLALFETENKHRTRISTRILQTACARQSLRERDALRLQN